MSDTVEVPIAWLERLVELSENSKVLFYADLNGTRTGAKIDDSRLVQLTGYIQSAKVLWLKEDRVPPVVKKGANHE